MPIYSEVARILRTYQGYERDRRNRWKWSEANPGFAEIVRERDHAVDRLLSNAMPIPPSQWRVLEVGCGRGKVIAGLRRLGAIDGHLYGVDLRADAIQAAQIEYPNMHWHVANVEELPFDGETFDCVLAFTVFTSVLDRNMSLNMAKEIRRVLRPGGVILWYDFRFRNPWNPHVQGMSSSRIRLLFPCFKITLQSITVIPPLARGLGTIAPRVYSLFAAIPLLRSHYLGLIAKQSRAPSTSTL
jgi:SAM-dependent methyltransferase